MIQKKEKPLTKGRLIAAVDAAFDDLSSSVDPAEQMDVTVAHLQVKRLISRFLKERQKST